MAGKSGLIAQSSSFGEGDFPSVGVGVFYPSIADDGVVDVFLPVVEGVEHRLAITAVFDEPVRAQHLQLVRHRRLRRS